MAGSQRSKANVSELNPLLAFHYRHPATNLGGRSQTERGTTSRGDYPQQFLDVSPFQALTIEHSCLSHTIDLDEKLFAREPCLNRRASGPL